jgi:glycosyltransferase involved in cell wall biosynthesis
MVKKNRYDNVNRAKLIHVITMLEFGGAQENTLINCSRADRDLFDVTLVSGRGGVLDERTASIEGIDHISLPTLVREIRPMDDLMAFLSIFFFIKKLKRESGGSPVIVHTHSSKAGILGRAAAYFARAEVIVHTVHGFGFTPLHGRLLKRFLIFLEKAVARFTDRFVIVAKENGKEGVRVGIFEKERCVLIRSGFDTMRFREASRDAGRERLGLEKREFAVGMVACFKPQKSPLDFIRAARVLKEKGLDCKYILVGDGELRPMVMKEIVDSGMGNDFIMTGWLEGVEEIIAALDVLVLTSLHEGLPKVIPQGLLLGVPVVATAVDGTKEIVRDGLDGYLVGVNSPGEVAARIADIAEGKLDPTKVLERRDEIAREFSENEMVAKHGELYCALLKEKGCRE